MAVNTNILYGNEDELPQEIMECDGAPVDGEVGTGTYASKAKKGQLLIDTTNANIYINAGTKTSVVWKLITRAA